MIIDMHIHPFCKEAYWGMYYVQKYRLKITLNRWINGVSIKR
jgi:hypothetical protein